MSTKGFAANEGRFTAPHDLAAFIENSISDSEADSDEFDRLGTMRRLGPDFYVGEMRLIVNALRAFRPE